MKIFLGVLAFFTGCAIIIAALVFSSQRSGVVGSLNDSNLKIDDIRGDRLGMTLRDYQERHPYSCVRDLCSGHETYAGIDALKSATFFHGQLYQLYYSVDAFYSGQLLQALKEKYGDPGCTPGRGHRCRWSNGKVTIDYSDFEQRAKVDFTLDDVARQASEEFSKEQAHKVKTDQ